MLWHLAHIKVRRVSCITSFVGGGGGGGGGVCEISSWEFAPTVRYI